MLKAIHTSLLSVLLLISCATSGRAANDADYSADLKRIQEISLMYGNPALFESQPKIAIENLKQLPGAKAERDRIAKKYEAMIHDESFEGRNMAGVLKRFDDFVARFEEAAQQYAADAPAKIDQTLEDVLRMGKEAVDNQRPLYFDPNGGIAQRLGWAQMRYEVLAALAPDSPQTTEVKTKLDAARQQIAQMKSALNDQIIASNTVPRESYSGSDKPQLIELIKSKWAQAGVPGDNLKTGINSQSWQRDTRWHWDHHDTWNKSDKSHLQGYIITKIDGTHAVLHHINLTKDHLANDTITATFFEDPKAEPDVSQKLLLKNVR